MAIFNGAVNVTKTANVRFLGDSDHQHNYNGNKENILVKQAVAEMKDKICNMLCKYAASTRRFDGCS